MIGENRYSLSRNYKKLRHYLDSGLMIVCFVSYKCDGVEFRDICTAAFEPDDNKDFECYRFVSRGMEYIRFNEANTKYEFYPKSFDKMMRLHDVEFIDFD